MKPPVHGFKYDKERNQYFFFGIDQLTSYIEQLFYLPLPPGVSRPKIAYDKDKTNIYAVISSTIKLRTDVKRFLKSSQFLIKSLAAVDDHNRFQGFHEIPFSLLSGYSLNDVEFFLEITFAYLRVLTDDIAVVLNLFYKCENQTWYQEIRKFTKFCNSYELFLSHDSTMIKIIENIKEDGWFDRLNKIRNSIFHGSSSIQLIFAGNDFTPHLIDNNQTISTDLLWDLRKITRSYFMFLDKVFFHFYDYFLPKIDDKKGFEEFCIQRPFITFTGTGTDFRKVFDFLP